MTLTIPGELINLNDYIDAERTNRFIAAKIKREETERVAWVAKGARLPTITTYPVTIGFHWITKDARVDCDNVCFARKFILDGLVMAGVLTNDGRRQVAGFDGDRFSIDRENPRIEITIRELV